MNDKEDFPDLSKLIKLIGIYLVASLAGLVQKNGTEFERAAALASRLVDKAVSDYRDAKIYFEKEKTGEKGFLYAVNTINYLENCLNAVSRVYKLLPLLSSVYASDNSKPLADIRNSIEHIDERISRGVEGPLVPYVTEDNLSIRINGDQINIVDLANEISRLHNEILSIFSKIGVKIT